MGTTADLIRRYFEVLDRAGRSGEIEEWLSFISEDVVWEAMEDAPDAGTYRGHAGLRVYFEDWLATVDPLSVEGGEPTEVGDFFVSDIRMTAAIKGTDSEMDLSYAIAIRITDGKIVSGKEFRDRDEAIAYAEANSARASG
jgi:ketosteroid isomerase-like protein